MKSANEKTSHKHKTVNSAVSMTTNTQTVNVKSHQRLSTSTFNLRRRKDILTESVSGNG